MTSHGNSCLVVVALSLILGASAHGWVTKPISKNHLVHRHWVSGMPGDSFRWEPQSSANGNLAGSKKTTPAAQCGAQSDIYAEGLGTWAKFYQKANVPIPTLVPGQDLDLEVQLTADHGGQSWLMVACGDRIADDVDWTYLERAAGDRGHHFMPNHPGIFAWRTQEYGGSKFRARYTVPNTFSCPGGNAVGRWVWKTGNTCIDTNNMGRPTEKFARAEYDQAVNQKVKLRNCGVPPEVFISCFDFKVAGAGDGPAPTLAPLPTPSPSDPTPSPSDPEPEPEPEPEPTLAPSPPPTGPCAKEWQQCGGNGFTGTTCCEDGLVCEGGEWWKACKRPSSLVEAESHSFLK